MVEPRAPCRRGTSDHEAATAAISTIDASAPAWSCPRSSTCMGVHGMCRRTRPGLWWSGVMSSFSTYPRNKRCAAGGVSGEGPRAGRARLADAASVRRSRRPGRSAGPGRSRGLPGRKAPRRGRPGRGLAAGPAPPPPRPPRLPRRGTAPRDRRSSRCGVGVEIHAGPGRQCPGHGQERGARTAIQDTARVHVLETIRQHDDGAIGCHLADGEAQTFRKGVPGKPCARLLNPPGAFRARRHGHAGSHPTACRSALAGQARRA